MFFLTVYSEVIHWVPIYVQDSVLGIGNLAVSKTDKNSCFDGAYILVGRQSINQWTYLYKQMSSTDTYCEEK